MREGVSFPVGKVDELHLYPMSFEEFLEGIGEEKLAEILLKKQVEDINRFREQEWMRNIPLWAVGALL